MYKKFFRAMLPLTFYLDEPAGGGGTPPAPTGGTPPAPTGGTPPAPTGEWYDNFQDANVKEWVKAYGPAYKTPEAMALKAYNLEKFVGAEKSGRGVIVPKPDAPPEEWNAFYKKVGGVPEKPDGYAVPEDLKADPMMAKFREAMHKAGLPPMFFNAAVEWYKGSVIADVNGQIAARDAELNATAERELSELQIEWAGRDETGANIYDRKTELGRRAAAQFIPHENAAELEAILTRMEGAIGTKTLLKLWANIGESTGEHAFERGDGGPNGFGASTPEGARIRISELKRDTEWVKRFTSGDSAAKREWDELHKIAHPEQK